jgi:hypothetical protein
MNPVFEIYELEHENKIYQRSSLSRQRLNYPLKLFLKIFAMWSVSVFQLNRNYKFWPILKLKLTFICTYLIIKFHLI